MIASRRARVSGGGQRDPSIHRIYVPTVLHQRDPILQTLETPDPSAIDTLSDFWYPKKKTFGLVLIMSSLVDIPAYLLAELPLATPPPGVNSNFDDPPTSGTKFIIVGGVMIPLMLVFFTIRIITKYTIIRRLSWDDCELRFPI